MLLKPKLRVNIITDIDVNDLKRKGIEALILDVDNTLIDLDKNMVEGLEEWAKLVKKEKIKMCIASNSFKVSKIEKVANILAIPFVYFSTKPLKRGLKKAKKILQIEDSGKIAEIGDQLFTDVLASNRMGMYSILTNPICEEKHFISKLKRKLEKKVLDKNTEEEN